MTETSTRTNGGLDAAGSRERARLSFELDVDICVVGAGLAGLTVALEAARLGASVAVLEGRHVGWNASGHNLGTVMPGFGLPLGELIERVGFEDARELWALSQDGAEFVRANASEELMPGIGRSDGALEVSNVEAGDELISRLQMLGEDFDTEVEGWQVERVRDELGTDRYFHGVYYPKAFQVDGRKYVHGLAALARRAGARIFEDTPVVSIDPSGIRKRIVTPSARLRASHIVLAGNTHLGAPLRRLSETLLPVWRYAAVTAPLGGQLADLVKFKGSVSDADRVDHFRVIDGDRLMWASPETTWEMRPQHFAAAIQRRIRTILPKARSRRDCRDVRRRRRTDRAWHAADWPAPQRPLGRERIWPSGTEYLGDGRAIDRAQHPLGATNAGGCSRRSSWSGPAVRPAGPPDMSLAFGGGEVRLPPVHSRATGSGTEPGNASGEARLAEANRQATARPLPRRPRPEDMRPSSPRPEGPAHRPSERA